MREIEVKARVDNFEPIIKKLESLGCSLSQPIIQDDQVFLQAGIGFGDLTAGINVLRIRRQEQKNIFTLKIRGTRELDSVERETEISDPDKLEEILKYLGYREVMRLRKSRRKCQHGELEICLDEVEGLGKFIEAEKMVEDGDGGEIQNELFNFLVTLGAEKDSRVSSGYDILMYKKNEN
ncbi:class IV adenylate cyclase [Patescibacteria group bacterium]|nr:MAG: class IV adenylate cyclase [Patescibacteria group bacterium]